MSRRWSVVSSRILHEGRPHRLRLDTCLTAAGVEVRDYFVREVNDIAMVFPVTDDGRVVLVRQYRHAVGEDTLELPQGLLEDGETPLAAGARELAEETGYGADALEPIAELLASPAVQTSRIHVLLGRGARPGPRLAPDPDEDLDVELAELAALEGLVAGGQVRSASSVAGILLALRHLRGVAS